MPDGTRITAEQVKKIWTSVMGEPPSSGEYHLFARYLGRYGDNNYVMVFAMYLIHLIHRDARSIEIEILDKGPSVLHQVRELNDAFDKTLDLVKRINFVTMSLTTCHSSLEHRLREREKREQTKWENIYNLVVRQRHPLKLLATLWAGMLFVNFAGLILIAYVLGLIPPLMATGTPPTAQAETSDRPMQSWQQPDRGLTPGELAAEEREWETR